MQNDNDSSLDSGREIEGFTGKELRSGASTFLLQGKVGLDEPRVRDCLCALISIVIQKCHYLSRDSVKRAPILLLIGSSFAERSV